MTLSRNLTANLTVVRSFSQSTLPSSVTNLLTSMLPRLQLSWGRRGCSPQGLVASIRPSFGVGLCWFIVSRKIMPGSPFFQAIIIRRFHIALAFSVSIFWRFRGLIRSKSLSSSTAFINLSVAATEMLKFRSTPSFSFATMKSMISGWSTRSMPMLAPLRRPPCFITSVAVSYILAKDMGPEAMPPVVLTTSRFGRRREKENPVPPPVLWIIAAAFKVSNMLSIESSMGRTKQALSCLNIVPAFMRVGELGMNSRLVIIWKYWFSKLATWSSVLPYCFSTSAMLFAIRLNIWLVDSIVRPFSSFLR